MQRVFVVLDFPAISDDLCVFVIRSRNTTHVPARGEFNGNVVQSLVRIFKIDGVDAIGMFEEVLFFGGKHAGRKHYALARTGRPARNFYVELRDQRGFRAGPIRLVGQFRFGGSGNIPFHRVLQKLLAGYLIRMADLQAVVQGFQAGEGNSELAFQIAALGELKLRFALDARFGTGR